MHYLDQLAARLVEAHDDEENRHAWVTFRDRKAVLSAAIREVLEIEVSEGRLLYSDSSFPENENTASQSFIV
jgi:hypothetical protein